MKPIEAGEQYEALTRYVHRAAVKRGEVQIAGLAMHKPLLPPATDAEDLPPAGMQGLNRWLAEKIARTDPEHVVDLGCGFGVTIFGLAEIHQATRLQGLAASPFQIRIARQLVERLGMAHRAQFAVGDFEEVKLEPSVDTLVAVESIGYSQDLDVLARHLTAQLATGAHVFLVDDWRTLPSEEMGPAYERFLPLWGRSQIPSSEETIAAFTAAGCILLETIDLSAQVPAPNYLTTLRRALLGLATPIMPIRRYRALMAAFLGGCHLETLYAEKKTRYQFIHLQKQGT